MNASMYDAQQGATSGAQIDANTATGTNLWHGQVYGTFANNALNAAPYFFNQEYQLAQEGVGAFPQSLANPALHRWTTGGTLGAPILKNKAFFFVGYQHLYNSDQSTGLSQFDVPPLLTDDRSAAGLWGGGRHQPQQGFAHRAIDLQWHAAGWVVHDSFGTEQSAISVWRSQRHPLRDLAADRGAGDSIGGLQPEANGPTFGEVLLPDGSGRQAVRGFRNRRISNLSGERFAGSRYWQHDLDRSASELGAASWLCPDGSYGRFSQTAINSGGDPNFGVGSGADGYTPSPGLPGILIKEIAANTSVSPGLKLGPYSSFANIGYYQNRLNPSTNVIFAVGKHTIVFGGGYSYTQLNITNNRTGIAQIVSSSFTKFLEDSVHSSNVLNSIDPATGKNLANRYYRSNEFSGYVQDKWLLKPNLTVTGGIRYDYHGGLTEKYGNIFNFDPSAYDVTGDTTSGFTVNNAGFVVAGNNKYYPTHGVTNSTLSGRQWGLSPRVGFAWQPEWNHGTVVFRGGFGMYFDRGELFSYLSQPAGSTIGGPFGVTEAAPLTANVVGTGSTLENPLGSAPTQPQYIPNSNPGNITALLQTTLNGLTGDSADFGKNCGAIDNQEGYTDCPDTLTFGAYDKNNVLPYTMNFTFNWQWQPTNDLAVTVGYTGNRGRHAVIPIPFNEPGIATPSNPINGETATYGFQVLNQNSFTGYDYNAIAGEPWNTEDGGNTDFRTPFVGYSPNAAFFKTVGNSAYDGLETHLEKRLSHNFQAGASYTFSHTYDEQSDIGLFFTGDNPNNLRSSYARADFDRTNVFSANFLVALPNAAAPHSLLSYFTNDWNLTGIAILQNGEPYSLYEFYGAVGSVFFGDYPTLMNPVLPIKTPNNPKLALTGNNGAKRGAGGNYIPSIDPTQIDIHYVAPGQMGVPVSTGSDPQDIYETDFAPGQRNLFRQAPQKRLDISFRKSFRPTERMSLQYAFNIFNVTNTTSLDVPQNQTQIRQASACSNTAIEEGNNCSPSEYFVNYGQIVTGIGGTNQQSALTNLDQLPYHNGSGKGITIPTVLPQGVGSCATATITGGCPNNGANFGSVTGAIGSNRIITMGLNLQF